MGDADGRAAAQNPPLAVVMKGWPRLSETFIAQELALLEAKGLRFDIWSLREPTDAKRHALHAQVTARVRYLPEYLHHAPWRVLRGLLAALPQRRFWPMLWMWLRDLARDRTVNRVRRFGQALVLARELPAETRALYAHFLHTPGSVTRYAAALRGLPWSFSAHAKDIWTIPEWERREKIAGSVFGATCTAYGAAELRRLAPAADRIELIYHGLDISRFPDPPERAPTRPRPEAPFKILSVGRLVEKKGFDRLLEGLGRLPADLPWRWIHIGGGELSAALKAQADAAGVGDRIDWRGPSDQAEVIAAMREADLFALTSRVAASGDRDGLPNVLMEAATQQLAILATAAAAIPEFIEDGVDGVLTDDDPDAIARHLMALAQDPERRLALGRAARVKLLAQFQADEGVERLARLLRAQLGDAPAPLARTEAAIAAEPGALSSAETAAPGGAKPRAAPAAS